MSVANKASRYQKIWMFEVKNSDGVWCATGANWYWSASRANEEIAECKRANKNLTYRVACYEAVKP